MVYKKVTANIVITDSDNSDKIIYTKTDVLKYEINNYKVINIDDDGNVVNFIMNDKCAAGTGKFLEVTSHKLGSDIENIDDLAKGATPENISSMCTVFAESEIVSLLRSTVWSLPIILTTLVGFFLE